MNFACKVTKKSQSMLIMPWDLMIIEILLFRQHRHFDATFGSQQALSHALHICCRHLANHLTNQHSRHRCHLSPHEQNRYRQYRAWKRYFFKDTIPKKEGFCLYFMQLFVSLRRQISIT